MEVFGRELYANVADASSNLTIGLYFLQPSQPILKKKKAVDLGLGGGAYQAHEGIAVVVLLLAPSPSVAGILGAELLAHSSIEIHVQRQYLEKRLKLEKLFLMDSSMSHLQGLRSWKSKQTKTLRLSSNGFTDT